MSIEQLYSRYLLNPTVITDSRRIESNCIFFALQGDHFDGNRFAAQAIEDGASLAVVSDPSLEGERYYHVPDTLIALQELARHHRQQLHIPVVGITGSNGKTTTKELVTRVLAMKYKVHATQGNLNNHIGVPLTILGIPPETELLVCEMGANHIGEIEFLCSISMPTHGLITNIGKAHLEGFGSFEGVKKAKGELYEYVEQHNGILFLNADDPSLVSWMTRASHVISYALGDDIPADIRFELIPQPDGRGFSIRDRNTQFVIHSNLFGQYNAHNVLAAYTVGKAFDVDERDIAEAIANYVPGNNRSQTVVQHGCTIIKDAYNANPSSMELAIRAFDTIFHGGIMVLGDMKELGESSISAHAQLMHLEDLLA
jgi:UDP-N-acetylmuramoyl-tripeptide--D-alanyl-D-alanine ligase